MVQKHAIVKKVHQGVDEMKPKNISPVNVIATNLQDLKHKTDRFIQDEDHVSFKSCVLSILNFRTSGHFCQQQTDGPECYYPFWSNLLKTIDRYSEDYWEYLAQYALYEDLSRYPLTGIVFSDRLNSSRSSADSYEFKYAPSF
jgi:protein-arginine kinase activator protein McsA